MNSVSLVDGHIDEPKLTVEQIIKALERCGNIVDSSCKECAFHKTYNASCVVKLMKNTLDLINRKNAQIEENEAKIAHQAETIFILEKALSDRMADIERLEGILDKRCDVCPAVTTARKEFAERLKEISYIPNMSLTGQYVVDVDDIDNLLKEMDGESE